MRTITFSVLLGVVFLNPTPALSAGNIEYSYAQQNNREEVLIQTSTLTTNEWYRCSLKTLLCTEASSTTTLEQPISATRAILAVWKPLLPSGAQWLTLSPDFRYVAFFIPATQYRKARTFGVFDTITKKTYTKKESVGYWDLLTEGVSLFSFSPDSKTLPYISDVANYPTVHTVSLSSLSGSVLKSTQLFTRAYTVADVVWKDSDTLLYIANRESPYQWSLYEYTLSKNKLEKIDDSISYATPLQRIESDFLLAKNDSRGLYPVVYRGHSKTIETFNLPTTAPIKTLGVEVGTLIEDLKGVYLREEGAKSHTLIVWLHGGPYRQNALGYHPYKSYGGYDWMLEIARQENVGVLKLDYAGSSGFGREYAESISGDIGVADAVKTAKAITDFAQRNNYTDVYVAGNSYGGYLALKLLVDEPSLYKGALSINGVADWMTLLNALNNSIFNVQFGGAPNESNYALYNTASIYNGIDGLGLQKIILAHGTDDKTIPYKQSLGLANALERINKNVTLVPFEGEDHVFKKPESFTKLCALLLTTVGKTNTGKCSL
ncbi:hypothetical protein COU15_01210 [Candidatus Kaiserbacteria bacterium CG10_big_fil_rev_8_21_14_0_10_45_20]|uniref:Peptidase S9 prolyl oligopeptidase catalytic domain-containing protein n=1 Tax=Candidatus Kaiserbacteria bacterium CG10_big_fil_rev_8_21_14_0_10_45_20 TaxID=1974607 RepID=A0A2H0UI36_9BACT|nr:MAG: hypothetical protein COU15_01210 [Candidatus Kaiserbacteria bacterium CG10_big_fil_rev_8_21_14_0_10_45_20]